MNPKLVRNLIVGNLAVYTVVAALIGYAYFFPTAGSAQAVDGSTYNNNAPLISIMLPTPTAFAPALKPGKAGPIATLVPLETPVPVTSAPEATPAPQAAPVQDGGLVPASNINILLLGTDQRPGESNWRTDTIVLLSINQAAKTVGLLTIPRDLYVNIPSIGMQRINTADFYGYFYDYPGGGPNLIKTTIEQNLGIRVHYYVRGGFDAFRKAIDILGGIDVDVNCPLYEQDFYDDYGHTTINFQPGLQTMDGVSALRYARSRYTTNDYDRGRRQRQVLLAMWDKATSLNLLPKWPQLYSEMKDSIQTDLSPVEMAGLAYIGTQLKMDKIKSMAIDNRSTIPYTTPEGAEVLLPNNEKIHALLVDFFSPLSDSVNTVEQENATIQIVSGNPDAAGIAATFLKRSGLDTNVGAAVPLEATSSITEYKNKPATVQQLAALLHLDPSEIRTATDGTASSDIVVNLGSDYNACQK